MIDTIGVKKLAKAKQIGDTAYRCWLSGLICSAVAGLYGLYRLQEREKSINKKEGDGAVEAKKIEKYVPFAFSFAGGSMLMYDIGSAPPRASSSFLTSATCAPLPLLLAMLTLTTVLSVLLVLSAL